MTSRIGRVDIEGVLVADRLRRVATADRCRVDAPRAIAQRGARACRIGGSSTSSGSAARSPIVAHAVVAQGEPPSARRRPTAARSAAAPGTPPPSPGGTTTSPSGLRRSDAILATSWVGATPTEIVSASSSRTAALICRAIASPSPNSVARAGDVEERLVDRDGLDERREPPQDRHHLAADAPVLARRRRAGRSPCGQSAAGRRAAASPSGRRTRAPRSSPR